MLRGYIKIWRKIEDSGLIQNATALQLAMWCLLKATHKKRKQIVGTSSVELLPGQFVFGRKVAAQELKTTEQRIRTSLKVLKNMEFLTINPTNKYSVISIINWDIYQMDQPTNNQQPNQVPTSSQPAANHKQECKHVKNNPNPKGSAENDNEIPKNKKEYPEDVINLVSNFQAYIKDHHGNLAPVLSENLTKNNLICIDRIMRIDKFELDYIKQALWWGLKNSFWSSKIRSLSTLREKSKNGLSKFQNLASAYEEDSTPMQYKKQATDETPSFYTGENIVPAPEGGIEF